MAARPWISLEVPPTSSSETELQDSTTLYLFDSRVRKWRRLRFIVRDKVEQAQASEHDWLRTVSGAGGCRCVMQRCSGAAV